MFHAATFVSLLPVGCTVLGAPRLSDWRGNVGADGRRGRFCPRFPRRARLASTAQRMQFRGHSPRTIFTGAPTLHQPLSHGAMRRDSSPFRGAEAWEEVCGVYASASHDADTYVSLTPVRGGVLDAPRSPDRRATLDASVRLDQPHPRFPQRVRIRPPPNASNPAGTARAPFRAGEPTLSVIPGRAGVEARPYVGWGRYQRRTGVIRRPKAGRRGRRPYGVLRRFRRETHAGGRPAGAAAQNKIPRGGGEFCFFRPGRGPGPRIWRRPPHPGRRRI